MYFPSVLLIAAFTLTTNGLIHDDAEFSSYLAPGLHSHNKFSDSHFSRLLKRQQGPTIHTVQVSDPTGKFLNYTPSTVQANVGDIVQFRFNPLNHTITSSNFNNPCKPQTDSDVAGTSHTIQKSGFIPVSATDQTVTIYNMIINDTSPIWIYCGQGLHCANGMSMVINPDLSKPQNSLADYQSRAQLLLNGTSSTSSSSSESTSSTTSGTSTNTAQPSVITPVSVSTTGQTTASSKSGGPSIVTSTTSNPAPAATGLSKPARVAAVAGGIGAMWLL